MRLSDVFQEFINYSTLERCLEPSTISWYKENIKSFYKYLRYKVLKPTIEVMTVEILRDYFITRRLQGNSPRTILNIMQALKAFSTFLVKRNYLEKNPFDKIERPKLKKKLPEFLDEEESRQLLKVCITYKRYYKSQRIRDVAIVALFLFTGIRRKELLNLKLKDLSLDKGLIKVSAKNKERIVPLNESARDFLAEYLKVRPRRTVDNVFVSTNRKAGKLTEQGLGDVFRDIKKVAKINKKICPQVLRHTFCTLMLRNGVNIRDIQLLAGHSDISTTAKFYLGCDEKQLKKAVENHPLNI